MKVSVGGLRSVSCNHESCPLCDRLPSCSPGSNFFQCRGRSRRGDRWSGLAEAQWVTNLRQASFLQIRNMLLCHGQRCYLKGSLRSGGGVSSTGVQSRTSSTSPFCVSCSVHMSRMRRLRITSMRLSFTCPMGRSFRGFLPAGPHPCCQCSVETHHQETRDQSFMHAPDDALETAGRENVRCESGAAHWHADVWMACERWIGHPDTASS